MVTYKQENVYTIPGLLMELFVAHGKEVIGDGYNLNLAGFIRAMDSGVIRVYTARIEKHFIGYCAYSVACDMMRADVRTADCCAIYVKPEYRGRVSVRLMRFSEQCLIAEGVKAIVAHSRLSAPGLTSTYEKMGYTQFDIALRKEI